MNYWRAALVKSLVGFFLLPSFIWAKGHLSPLIQEEFKNIKLAKDGICLSESLERNFLDLGKVSIKTFPVEDRCNNSKLSKLARIFYRLKSLQINFPEIYDDNEVLQDLKNPWDFFINKYDRIELMSSKASYASFSIHDRKISLSHDFFNIPDLLAIALLIHEAAHGRSGDTGHNECRIGDLRFTLGACDFNLETKRRLASGYNYQFWLLWGLAKFGRKIKSEEKQYLSYEASHLMMTRFNYTSDYVARNDLVILQKEDGALKILDPIFKEEVNIGLNQFVFGGKAKVLVNQYRTNGALFIDEKGKVFDWELITGVINEVHDFPFQEEMFPIINYGAGFNYKEKVTFPVFVSENGFAWILSYREVDGEPEFIPYDLVNQHGHVDQVHLLIGQILAVKYLTGEVRFFSGDRNDGELNQLFMDIEGIFSDYLNHVVYLIDKKGQLFVGKKEVEVIGSMISIFKGMKKKRVLIPFASQGKIKVYREGVAYRGVLDINQQLFFQPRKKDDYYEFRKEFSSYNGIRGIKDFIFIPNIHLKDKYRLKEPSQNVSFISRCQVKNVNKEPWLNRSIGLTENSELVVFDQGICRVWMRGVSHYEIVKTSLSESPFGISQVKIAIIFLNGERTIIEGY